MKKTLRKGQTLVVMLVIIGFIMMVMAAALVMSISGSKSVIVLVEAMAATYTAEGGMENGLMQLLRNPNYTGEVVTVGNGVATITRSGAGPYQMTSVGEVGNSTHKVSTTVSFDDGVMNVTNWRDDY